MHWQLPASHPHSVLAHKLTHLTLATAILHRILLAHSFGILISPVCANTHLAPQIAWQQNRTVSTGSPVCSSNFVHPAPIQLLFAGLFVHDDLSPYSCHMRLAYAYARTALCAQTVRATLSSVGVPWSIATRAESARAAAACAATSAAGFCTRATC